MKQFLQKKAKLVFLCMLVLLTCTACANPRGKDGKTRADQIIASEETTIDVNQINVSDITDKALKKEIKKNIKDGIGRQSIQRAGTENQCNSQSQHYINHNDGRTICPRIPDTFLFIFTAFQEEADCHRDNRPHTRSE